MVTIGMSMTKQKHLGSGGGASTGRQAVGGPFQARRSNCTTVIYRQVPDSSTTESPARVSRLSGSDKAEDGTT